MQKHSLSLVLGIFLGLIIGLFIGKQIFEPASAQSEKNKVEVSANRDIQNDETPAVKDSSIPSKVYEVLKYIKEHHSAMPGYMGGRVFSNREKLLPQTDSVGTAISYQEWDVNPKAEGQNRGTERIVTGSDGRSWYTNDHYQSFKLIP